VHRYRSRRTKYFLHIYSYPIIFQITLIWVLLGLLSALAWMVDKRQNLNFRNIKEVTGIY